MPACVYTSNMASTHILLAPRSSNLPRIKRWLVVLPISILLHSIVIYWAGLQIHPPSLHPFNVVHASLHHASLHHAAQETVADFAEPAHTSGHHAAALPLTPTLNPAPIAESARATPPIESSAPNPLAQSAPANAAANGWPAQHRTALQYNVNLPPSAALHYEVVALKKGVPLLGQGAIVWQSNGIQYSINGSTDMVDGGSRSFQSEGEVGQSGIAPLRYSEKSSKRSATNTHFQRERGLISFSASTATYARQGDEQDRASIFLQLAGIGRGAPGIFKADGDIEIFVAGVRDGDTWRIHVVDEETIDLPAGKVTAWHLVRMPRPGTYEQQLDIWLAPSQNWYPVKFRYKQANGDTLDMSLIRVSSATVQ